MTVYTPPKKWIRQMRGEGPPLKTRQYKPVRHGPAPTAEEIKAARLEAKLTQRAAAELISRTERSWQYYEKGLRTMDEFTWRVWRIRAMLDEPSIVYRRPGQK